MNREMLKKMRNAKSVEEVIAIAKEYGQEITEEKAGELLDRLNDAGGGCPTTRWRLSPADWSGVGLGCHVRWIRPGLCRSRLYTILDM